VTAWTVAFVGTRLRATLLLVGVSGAESVRPPAEGEVLLSGAALVGTRRRAMLSLVCAFRAKSVRPPAEAELLSLCVAKEKVTKEKGHPAYALSGLLPGKYAAGLRGLSTGHPALTPNWPASLPATLRAFLHPAAASEGTPGRAARILRVLFRRARSRTEHKSDALLWPLPFSSSPSAGQDGPLLCRRPCAAMSRGRQAAQQASTGMSMPFRPDRSPVEKPGPGSRTCRPGMGGKRQAGWPFSLATQRESNSGAIGARTLFALDARTSESIARKRAPTSATSERSDSGYAGGRKLFALNAAKASRTRFAPTVAGGRTLFAVRPVNRIAGTFE
jgi:hypothetical protein